MQNQPLASRLEAAQEINCAVPTISEYVCRGWLDGVRLGKRLMIRRDSIQRFLANGSAPVHRRQKNGG